MNTNISTSIGEKVKEYFLQSYVHILTRSRKIFQILRKYGINKPDSILFLRLKIF